MHEVELTIREDSKAVNVVSDYRSRFETAPLGVWSSCNDLKFGIGFEGIVGLGADLAFNSDHFGTLHLGGSQPARLVFEWRNDSPLVVQVRVHSCDAETRDNWLDPDDFDWQRIEYDFMVVAPGNVVLMHDPSRRHGVDPLQFGLWRSPWPVMRVAEPRPITVERR